jgi:hypothetical protein
LVCTTTPVALITLRIDGCIQRPRAALTSLPATLAATRLPERRALRLFESTLRMPSTTTSRGKLESSFFTSGCKRTLSTEGSLRRVLLAAGM